MSVSLRWSVGILLLTAVWQIALCSLPSEVRAVSVTTSTYAVDCGPMMPANPDIKGPITIVSATSAVSAIQSNTSRAHAQAAATSKIVGGVVIKSVTGTSWVDATLPNYDTKGASWSASASGTTLIVEPLPGMPQGMVDFQFATPPATSLTLEALGYNFSTPGYQPPTLQSIKRDQLPAGVPGSSFFDISVNTIVSVHQDGDGVNPPVDFTFLDGGYIFRSSGQVTPIGTLRPLIVPNQGGSTGVVDFSFAPMASPVFQIRSGVPFELTTQISIGMQNDFPIGMGLAFPGITNPVGGGTSFATNFAKVNDPGGLFTLFAIDPSVSHWTGGSGSWTSTTNWEFPTNGVDGVADFSTQNITADATVTLDGDFTAGKLLFRDLAPSHNWTIAPGAPAGSLTLKTLTAPPTIDVANSTAAPPTNSTGGVPAGFVNQTATIFAPIAGTTGLTKTGAGTLILSAQNTYSGPTNVALGGLTLDFSVPAAPLTNIVNPNSVLTLGGGAVALPSQPAGAVLTVKDGGTTNLQTFSATNLNDGFHAIRVNESPTGNVTLNLGAISHAPGGAVMFSLPANGQVTTTTPNANGILGGWATVISGNAPLTTVDWAENDGTGKIRAYNGYTPVLPGGPPTIFSNPLSNAAIDGTSLGAVAVVDPAPGVPTDINSLAMKDGVSRQVSIAAGSTLRFGARGGILKSSAIDNVNLAFNGGSITATGIPTGPSDLYLVANGGNISASGIVIGSTIQDDVIGSLRVVKTGTGAAQFSGANTYSGGTIITAGRLNALNSASLGTSSVKVMDGAQLSIGGTVNNAISIAGNGTAEASGLGALRIGGMTATFNGPITLDANARISTTLTSTTNFNGQITGPHHLEFGNGMVLSANRTFVLNNSTNDYTGNTTVSGATLRMGANNVVPNGAGKGNIILNGIVGMPTSLPVVLDLNGTTQTINALNSSPGTGSLTSVTGGGSLILGNANASGNFGGAIGGSLSLTKIGAGTQALGGTNTYTGVTVVAAGTLALERANGISATSAVTLQSGAKLATGGFNQTFSSFSPAGQSVLDLGNAASVFHFDSAQPWTGTFIIRNWDGLLAGGGTDRVTVGIDALATLNFLQNMSPTVPIQFENFDPGFHTVVQMNGEIEVLPNGLPYRMADFTRDNQVTADDLKPMLAAITDLEAFKIAQNITDDAKLRAIADINHDGLVNNRDLQPFLNLLAVSGAGSLAAVPEPSAMALSAIGLLALLCGKRKRRLQN